MTAETSNARGEWVLVPREPTGGMLDAASIGPLNYAAMLAAAPPPAAARGDVRGLVALAERVQYADTHALVSKDDAGEFICLPPWLWLEIRDAAVEALAAEGVQAGEVEQRSPDVAMALHWIDRYAGGIDDDCQIDLVAEALGVTLPDGYALSQQPKARELLDARVIDSLINANEEIHAAAAELASCLAEAIAAGATDIPLTHRAGMALTKHESLTEARNVR